MSLILSPVITSSSNPQFKTLAKWVGSSRERRLSGFSLLDGIHLIQAYDQHQGSPERLIVSESGLLVPEIQSLISAHPSVCILSDLLFKQISTLQTPSGVIGLIKTPLAQALPTQLENCVLLEDIQDPGNLGSILRTCAATGIGQVFLSPHSVFAWAPRVLRAGMGAHFSLQIFESCDLEAIVERFPGEVLVTQKKAQYNIFECDLTGPIALILGNEGAGVSQALAQKASRCVCLPMKEGAAESLNVAAAAAVCLYERFRQVGFKARSSLP